MKPFSLDTVLNFRKRRMDEAARRLTKATQTRDAVALKLQEKENVYKKLLREIDDKRQQGITIELLIMYEDQALFLKKETLAISKTLEEKEQIVINEKNNLIFCAREHKIMSQLKEKQNNAWRQYLKKEETRQLDEIAVIRHLPQN